MLKTHFKGIANQNLADDEGGDLGSVTSPKGFSDGFFEFIELIETLSRKGRCIDPDEGGRVSLDIMKSLDTFYVSLDGKYCLKSLVPVALKAMELGADPFRVAVLLDWRDFEELVLEYLSRSGFEGVRSVRLRSRRFEIDVLAVDAVSGYSLAIDCKHWSPGYSKSWKLREIARAHRAKVELMCNECVNLRKGSRILAKAKWVVPAVVTLTGSVRGYFNGSFIVPIQTFRDFLLNLDYYVGELSDYDGRVKNPCWKG